MYLISMFLFGIGLATVFEVMHLLDTDILNLNVFLMIFMGFLTLLVPLPDYFISGYFDTDCFLNMLVVFLGLIIVRLIRLLLNWGIHNEKFTRR